MRKNGRALPVARKAELPSCATGKAAQSAPGSPAPEQGQTSYN
jgi:hypothetical protein